MERSTMLLLSAIAILAFTAAPALSADADPILDFCVADLTNKNLFLNGLPCKNPATVTSADFKFEGFRGMGNTSNPLGIAIGFAAGATFPALNTQGLTLVKIDYANTGGFVPPHVHPRASEIILVLEGAVLVGFVDTSGNYFSATLYAGDLFVFPRGLVHFQLGLNSSYPSLSFSSLNSQNPGLSLIAPALFASTPGIPTMVLQKSFAITEAQVKAIKMAFGGH
ncbi:hypothetical protein GOP47_0002042 [Adiantum capillus-veneris]|uniref:Germin-like protein n=1 Tax=Adiantum capillus-veneris TaxID=13818 RepID=A0A9D4ZNU1_ADICA|nr:hypothetical protein GOP47_0002042 [Adiantum capillus-veneris]